MILFSGESEGGLGGVILVTLPKEMNGMSAAIRAQTLIQGHLDEGMTWRQIGEIYGLNAGNINTKFKGRRRWKGKDLIALGVMEPRRRFIIECSSDEEIDKLREVADEFGGKVGLKKMLLDLHSVVRKDDEQ